MCTTRCKRKTRVIQVLFVTSVYLSQVCSRTLVSATDTGRKSPTSGNVIRSTTTPNKDAALFDTRTRMDKTHVHGAAFPHFQARAVQFPCRFESKCECRGSVVDCSHNHGSLTFIPRLPPGVTFLNFAWNNLTAIVDSTFFVNATQIRELDLSHNGLSHIEQTSFRCLEHLTRLIVRGHGLGYAGLDPILSVHTLEYLDISHGPLGTQGPFPADLFLRHRLPRLRTLCVNDSQVWSLNMTVFQPLGNLTHLHVGGNQISHQFFTESMLNLEIFVLSRNGIFNFPETCRNGESLFPELAQLYLKNNQMSTILGEICLPKLAILVLSSNMFSHLVTGMFGANRFPILRDLYLDAMSTQIVKIDKHALQNPVLHALSMMYNNIDFAVPNIDPDCFQGLPNLEQIEMGHNYLNYVTSERFMTLFGHLTGLRRMCFGLDFIHNLTAGMFKPYQALTHLLLYDNEMTTLPDGVFDSLPYLRSLALGGNRLNGISENTFSPDTRHRLTKVDLSGDQFLCACDLLWFRQWLVSSASRFNHSWYTYDCKNLPGVTVQEFFMDQQACLFSRDAYAFIVVTVSVLILTTTLTSALFRFRWHLRLLLYEVFRGRGDLRMRRLQTQRFDYDVFVSYAADDLPFVRSHLLPELEGRLGLTLCVHERDFIPGKNIVDNIVQCVESSKKIMMIFSRSFVRSQWCQFELALCLRQVMDYDDALLVVCLTDVASRDLTSAMMAVLKTTSYIRWATHPDAAASFWGRIAQALSEIMP